MHPQADLNLSFDLLPIVERDVELKRSGGWYIGPCPFCGGVDRFNLHDTVNGWRWFCRHCGDGRYHDSAAYIMRRENIDFPTALEIMQGPTAPPNKEKRIAELREASEERQPPPAWRSRGEDFVLNCEHWLRLPSGAKALEYLHGRGLSDATLEKYRIGYNPDETLEPLAEWGLDGDGKVKLERGIIIPCYGQELYYIKIRRPVAPGSRDRKYVQVRGGKLGVFGWPNMRGVLMAVITEGEIDCMTLDQQAGDLGSICTFGNAQASPLSVDRELVRWMYKAGHVLACYDNDEAGQAGVLALQQNVPSVRVISLPNLFHDVNDAHVDGFDLVDWFCREVERLGLMT